MYNYIKALHIIFIVTWFSGMFYIVRLFIYNREAQDKSAQEKDILTSQFSIMIKRLWLGITWPSALLTLFLGIWMWRLFGSLPNWLAIKLCLVGLLYLYHLTLHYIYLQQLKGIFSWSSDQLRLWNELATLFLISIVLLVVVKQSLNAFWGVIIFILTGLALFFAIRIYKKIRK